MTLEKVARYGLIVGVLVVVIGFGAAYYSVTRWVIGDECPAIAALPAGVELEDRRRSEQRLDTNFDLRGTKGDAQPSCLKVFGQAKCEVDGPTVVAAQLGFNGEVETYAIPEGRTAIFNFSVSRLGCVLPDP